MEELKKVEIMQDSEEKFKMTELVHSEPQKKI